MDSKDKEHPLSLKVMRLTKPTFFTGIPVGCEPRDLPGKTFNSLMESDPEIPQGLSHSGIGQVLLLPQSFGNIYLGETFSCCICIHNVNDTPVNDVSVKATLQVGNQRISLLGEGEEEQLVQMTPTDIINKVINHEVKDIGTHILVCSVHYKGSVGVEQSFRKFFKFQVMKPLDVKTKFYNAESEEVYLEAGIQNITSGPIFLEKVDLEPAEYYTVTPLNDVIGCGEQGGSVFGSIGVVNPNDSRQYLYCLRPGPEVKGKPTLLKEAATIGKLDIVWRTNMADKGRLQTSQLQRIIWASQYGDLKVMVTKIPSVVHLEEPFEITISISNTSNAPLHLHLDLLPCLKAGVQWHNATSQALQPLPVGGNTTVAFTLMPLSMGLQTIAGVKVTDVSLKKTYDFENMAQVFVTNEMSDERKEFFSQWLQQRSQSF